MKKHLLLLVLCLTAVGAWAQETTVSSELTGKCVTIGTAATEVAVDKWYVLHNHNRNGCVSEETTAFKIRETPQGTFIASRIAGKLFKITASATEGQYYIVSGNGKYFDFESNDASTVSDDPVSYKIEAIADNTEGHFYIQHASNNYVADGKDRGANFVCWNTTVPTSVGGNNCYHLMEVAFTDIALEDGKVYNFVNLDNTDKSLVLSGRTNVSISATDTEDKGQLWYAIANADNSFTLRNMENGKYLRSSNAQSGFWTMADAVDDNCKFDCIDIETGYVFIASNTSGSYHYMHYSSSQGGVVCWETSAPATQWRIDNVEFTDEEIADNWEELASAIPSADDIAAFQNALDAIFADKACTELNSTYASMSDDALAKDANYNALSDVLKEMVLKVKASGTSAWAEPNAVDGKESWDGEYAKRFRVQLYEPYNETGAAAAALGINIHTNLNNPTGIYANKRNPLYIMVGGEIKEGSSLYLASWTGHGKPGNNYSDGVELKQGLNVVPFYTDNNATCINYVVHTFDSSKKGMDARLRKLSDYEDLKIHIEGGHINGYYNKVGDALWGEGDNAADWDYYAARANQTDLTVLGEKITLQFPLKDADTEGNRGMDYYLTGKNKIESVIDEWDNVMLWQRLLMGLSAEGEYTAANSTYNSPYSDCNEIFACTKEDADFPSDYADYYNVHGLSFGVGGDSYMYGGADHCGYHYGTMEGVIENLPTDAGAHWGPGHEIGHQHQKPLNMRGLTEVTNNLFSNVVLWFFGESTSRYNGAEGSLETVLAAYNSADGDFFSNNIWAQTHLYYKLFLYYHVLGHNTSFYPRLYEMLRRDPMTIAYEQDGSKCLLHFYKKCCEASGEDLTEFFRAYGFFKVMDNRLVGDYSNAVYSMTQEQIDAAIEEVKAKGYPANLSVLFINDATGEEILSHKGDVLDLYGGTTVCAEIGSYASFSNASSGYTYTVDGTTVTMNGTGGVGFAIYDRNGQLLMFTDKKTVEVGAELAEQIAAGEIVLKVQSADNTAAEVTDVMDGSDTDAQYAALGKMIETVNEEVLGLSDDTGTKLGYYRPDMLTALAAARDAAQSVYANQTTTDYVTAYDNLYAEYIAVLKNSSAKIALEEGRAYTLKNKAYPDRSMSVNSSGGAIGEATANTDAQKWYFIPTDAVGLYYVQNKSIGKYAGAISTSKQLKVDATETADAAKYTMRDLGDGTWVIHGTESMHCASSQSYQVVGWGWENSEASRWYITAAGEYNIPVSTSTDAPEHVFTLKTKSRYNAWMTSYTSPTRTETSAARFAFYAVAGNDDTYKIMCVDTKKWLSYTKAASYSNKVNFVTFADTQDAANEWQVTYNEGKGAYQFAPYNITEVASKYMNWYTGEGSNPQDNTTTTVGLWEQGAASDDGSAWQILEAELPETSVMASVESLSNAKVYTLKSGRSSQSDQLATGHYLLYHSDAPDNLASTYSAAGHPVAYSATNPNFQFAIYKFADKYYLYSLGAEKFVGNASGNNAIIPWSESHKDNIVIRQSENATYNFVLSTNGTGALNVAATADSHGVVNWADGYSKLADNGNIYQIVEVGDLSAEHRENIEKKVLLQETYVLKSGNGYWMGSYTSPTESRLGRFTFKPVDGKEGAFRIFSVGQNKWVSYNPVASYSGNGGKNMAVWADTEDAANYWKVELKRDGTSRISPYLSDGTTVAGMYMNWYGGVGGADNPYEGTANTIGLYDGVDDGGSKWTLTPVTEYTYCVKFVEPVHCTVSYGGTELVHGTIFTASEAVTEESFTITTEEGYVAVLAIDHENKVVGIICVPEIASFNDGQKIVLKNRHHSTYMKVSFSGGKLDGTEMPTTRKLWGQTGSYDHQNCWQLVATTHGDENTPCFYLYNPYYDWYVGQIATRAQAVDMVKNQEWAGKYFFETGTNETDATDAENYLVLKCLNGKGTGYDYLHQVSGGGVVDWNNSAQASHWEVIEVTEEMQNTWNTSLVAEFNKMTSHTVGTQVGEYTGMDEERNEEFKALSIPEDGTDIEKARYCVYSIYEFGAEVDALTINQPENGKFYRIVSKNSASNTVNQGKYVHNSSAGGTITISTENGASSIMYIGTDNSILNYASGVYLNDYINSTAVGTEAVAWTFSENAQVVGTYALKASGKSYFLSDWNSTTNTTYGQNDANAAWTFEPVEELPFTFKSAALGYATFNAPVAVQLPEGVTAYVTQIDGTTLKMYRFKDGIVPANTAVLLYYGSRPEADVTVNFTIVDDPEYGEFTNNFVGTVAAENLNTDKTCYSLQKQKNGELVGFFKKSSGTKGGFKAWLELEETAEVRAFTIIFDGDDATGIKEALGLEDEDVEIYDLNGRRLDKPAKGINIIGGKTVIVR